MYSQDADETPKPDIQLLIVDDLTSWLLGDTNHNTGIIAATKIRRLANSGDIFNCVPEGNSNE